MNGHLFLASYDGRCAYCDCRFGSKAASQPCPHTIDGGEPDAETPAEALGRLLDSGPKGGRRTPPPIPDRSPRDVDQAPPWIDIIEETH